MKDRDKSTRPCDECGSLYFTDSSTMAALCPECSNRLYGHPRCEHLFVDGRCTKCFWDGSISAYLKKPDKLPKAPNNVGRDNIMYNDDYATCERTYATLCIYSGDIEPEAVSKRLAIAPTHLQRRSDMSSKSKNARPTMLHAWFLKSEDAIQSKDSRRHIDWILDQLVSKADDILALQHEGCRMCISCYWLSKYGHGGPTLSPAQMQRLAALNLELWIDLYGP